MTGPCALPSKSASRGEPEAACQIVPSGASSARAGQPENSSVHFVMLKTVLRLHAVAAASYAVVLLFFPSLFWQLTAKDTATDFGLSVAQLLGAPMVFMTLVTWLASGLSDTKTQRRLAFAVTIYLATGFVVTLWQQLHDKWGIGGWSSPVSYLLFVALYGLALLREPRGSTERPSEATE